MQVQSEEIQAQNEELQTQSEEIQAQNKELHTQSVKLQEANKNLQESEARFRMMANAIPQLAWIAHPDGYIYWYNERWYSYTGTTPEQMEGWGWQSVHDPEVLPKVLEQWKVSIATGQMFDMEFPLRGADGIFRSFLTRGFPLKDADGNVIQWFGTNTDITESKQAQLLMKADLGALTLMHALSMKPVGAVGIQPLLQEIMDTAVAIVDAKMGTLQLLEDDSLRIVAHYGHLQPFLEFFSSAESQASACGTAMQCMERVVVEDIEKSSLFVGTPSLDILRNAGVRAVQSTPMISRKGKLLGLLTTQWNIPYSPREHDLWRIDLLARQAAEMIEQSRAEKALQESELRLRLLGDNLPDSAVYQYVHEFDGSVGFLYFSAGIEKLNDVSVIDVLRDPSTLHRQILPEHLEQLLEAEKRSASELSDFDMDVPMRLPDGQLRWMRLHSRPRRLSDGRTIWDGVQTDITERKLIEKALLESKAKLTAAFDSMTDAVFISDTQGKFTDFNDAFAKFHKFKNKDECSKIFAEYPDILDVFMADGTPAPLNMWAVPRALRGDC